MLLLGIRPFPERLVIGTWGMEVGPRYVGPVFLA